MDPCPNGERNVKSKFAEGATYRPKERNMKIQEDSNQSNFPGSAVLIIAFSFASALPLSDENNRNANERLLEKAQLNENNSWKKCDSHEVF